MGDSGSLQLNPEGTHVSSVLDRLPDWEESPGVWCWAEMREFRTIEGDASEARLRIVQKPITRCHVEVSPTRDYRIPFDIQRRMTHG